MTCRSAFPSGDHFSKRQPCGGAATSRQCVIMPRHAPVTVGRLNQRAWPNGRCARSPQPVQVGNFPPWSKVGCTLSRAPFLLCLRFHGKIARFAAALRFTVTLFRLRLPLATAAQRRNRRVKQDEVSARLARVKPDDRTTQRGECETFRLAIEIAEPPCLEEP